jgi:hypothetical protein
MTSGSLFFSCKKDDSKPAGCSISMTSLAGSYKLTALQYKSDASAAPVDYLQPMDDCEKDNILILKDDGTYVSDDAGTVCEPAEDTHGTWLVKGNTLTSDGVLNGTIASYDCKTMVYYTENAIKPGDRLTFTMVKQ